MSRRAVLLCFLLLASLAPARDKQESWLQIDSPHFTVICEGNEKQGRHIADQFERMRLLFHTAFPNMRVDPGAPIVVIAVKDGKAFRTLEPEAYLAKGQIELAGLFLRAPDKNYVLLRMDATGEHPYATVYHEYTHLLLSKIEWIPLWLNEGLAEFYQNTDISEKDAVLGRPSDYDIQWLRQNRILPLSTLFAVDQNSPYYHEEQKGSIFYAESWALTHYLEVNDVQNHTDKLRDYLVIMGNQVDSVTAATRAFGDLKQLQSNLEKYISQFSFSAFQFMKPLVFDDNSFKVQSISPGQVDAFRADVLAYDQREKDSRELLSRILHDDPNNTLAHETMGYLEFRAGHLEQAQDWYGQAVKLDSQSYLANYYFAAMALNRGEPGDAIDTQIETSLQKAIKLNPNFAAAYDLLAIFYGRHHKNLDQAHMLALQAIQLEPGNVRYRVNTAFILLSMQRETDAIAVLQNALKLAKTPGEVTVVQNELFAAQQSQTIRQQSEANAREFHEATVTSEHSEGAPSPLKEEEEKPLTGPHRTIIGLLKNVHCSDPAKMDADLVSESKTISLQAQNYYKIIFSALNYMPKPEFQPCTDLEGLHAKVEYIESAATKTNGVISIEMRK